MNQERHSEYVLGQDGLRCNGHLRQEGITGGKINSMCIKFLYFWSEIQFLSLKKMYFTPPKSTVNLEKHIKNATKFFF